MYGNVINGNYINFAICEYYNDDIFTQLSTLVMTMVATLDSDQQLKCYGKVEQTTYSMLWSFFGHHLELMFMKFDVQLLEKVVSLLIRGVSSPVSDVQSDSTNCINAFCEFVHEKLKRKPTQKSAYLV